MVITPVIKSHIKTLLKVMYQCHKLRQGGYFKLCCSMDRIGIFKEGEQVYSRKWESTWSWNQYKIRNLVNSSVMYQFGVQRGSWQNYSANIKCLHFGETGWRKPLIYFDNFPQIYNYLKIKKLKILRTVLIQYTYTFLFNNKN